MYNLVFSDRPGDVQFGIADLSLIKSNWAENTFDQIYRAKLYLIKSSRAKIILDQI
jgi:hypothetical protein